jgi:NAD(P)-dependent dehydrogenase (short-subunit alcohol dehydrogenase family)
VLKGRTAIITGAGGGIGAAKAINLHEMEQPI